MIPIPAHCCALPAPPYVLLCTSLRFREPLTRQRLAVYGSDRAGHHEGGHARTLLCWFGGRGLRAHRTRRHHGHGFLPVGGVRAPGRVQPRCRFAPQYCWPRGGGEWCCLGGAPAGAVPALAGAARPAMGGGVLVCQRLRMSVCTVAGLKNQRISDPGAGFF